MIVGELTCDGKKKSYEIFKDIYPNLYVMDLPQVKSNQGRELLKTEYYRFKEEMEELTGNIINVEKLKLGIEIANNKRKALHRLAKLRAANPTPISGLDALLINQIFFYDNPSRFTDSVNKICDELEKRIENGEGVVSKDTPRILISGCPMAVPNWKLPWLIETSGAIIVGEESCIGERGTQYLIDDSGDTVDNLMEAIIDRYFEIDCAIFTPNQSRVEHIIDMVEKYNADGVIHYGLQFCQPYLMEAISVEKILEAKGIPTLRIETDYTNEDIGQLKTRIEAFIELLE